MQTKLYDLNSIIHKENKGLKNIYKSFLFLFFWGTLCIYLLIYVLFMYV